MNKSTYDYRHKKIGYNYLSLKGDNLDSFFSLPANDLKTIMRAVNNYVNSYDLQRSLMSAKDGIRSFKKGFDSSKYRVIFICSPTAMSGLIMTYSCHYPLSDVKNNNQFRFNTVTGTVEQQTLFDPTTGIPYDTNYVKYFSIEQKEKMHEYCKKINGIWGRSKSRVTGNEYFWVRKRSKRE